MTLWEIGVDQHDRQVVLIEDVQRWLVEEADRHTTIAQTSFWNTAVYTYTAYVLKRLAAQLDTITLIEL